MTRFSPFATIGTLGTEEGIDMKCPYCRGDLKQSRKYAVQGFKHKMPGYVSTYFCQDCGARVDYFTSEMTTYLQYLERVWGYYKEEQDRNLRLIMKLRQYQEQCHIDKIHRQVEHLKAHLEVLLRLLP